MKPEKQQLIHDVLDEASHDRRKAILRAGSSVMRRRRWRRHAFQSLAAMAVLLPLVSLFLIRMPPPRPAAVAVAPSPPVVNAESLSDTQLLALFPDTPVGLITLANGNKRLVFLRQGDEERFLKRL